MHGLHTLSTQTFSSIADSQRAAGGILPSALALYNSLNEERLFTEKEIKEKQTKQEEEFKKLQQIAPKSAQLQ